MKTEIFKLPVSSIGSDLERPLISTLKAHRGDFLLCGLLFSNPSLVKIPLNKSGECIVSEGEIEIENLDVETQAGEGYLGVFNGLGSSTSGESVCTLLHRGFLPGVFGSLFGKDVRGKKGKELEKFIHEQGESGGALRHSVVHVEPNGDLRSRSFKEPGVLWDVAQVGDFVFGLSSTSIWREPYLKPDKREYLRSDLSNNFSLHRDEEGYFWFSGNQGRVLRMGLTDIKAQPTPLRTVDASGLFVSSGSQVDSWLYVSGKGSKTLMRIRRNPISKEDESQIVAEFEHPITAIHVVDHPEVRKVFFALATPRGAEIYSLPVIVPEDIEQKAPVPEFQLEEAIPEVSSVSSLTAFPQSTQVLMTSNEQSDHETSTTSGKNEFDWGPKPVLWGAAGRLGEDLEKNPPRIIRFSQI